jgi:hypothetical protein
MPWRDKRGTRETDEDFGKETEDFGLIERVEDFCELEAAFLVVQLEYLGQVE